MERWQLKEKEERDAGTSGLGPSTFYRQSHIFADVLGFGDYLQDHSVCRVDVMEIQWLREKPILNRPHRANSSCASPKNQHFPSGELSASPEMEINDLETD